MTKATYRRKTLLRAYIFRGVESVTITAGSMAAGRWALHWNSELGTSILRPSQEARRANWEWRESSEISKSIFSDTPLPITLHLLILSRQFHCLGNRHLNICACGDHCHSHNIDYEAIPSGKFRVYTCNKRFTDNSIINNIFQSQEGDEGVVLWQISHMVVEKGYIPREKQ